MGLTAGELDVALKAKDGISPAIKGVGSNVSGLGGIVGRFGGLFKAVIAVAAVAAVAKFAKSSYDYFKQTGAAIADFTRLTGATVQQSSLMLNLAKRFGVDGQSMTTAFKMMTKNEQGAIDGSKLLNTAWGRLGISMNFLKNHTPTEVFLKARDALSQMHDVAMRNATAAAIFGRGYQGMLKIITRTPAAMKEAIGFIKGLGLVWTNGQMQMFKAQKEQSEKNALMWDAIKLKASSVIVPLVGKLLPLLGKGLMALQGPMKWVSDTAGKMWKALSAGAGNKVAFGDLSGAGKVFRVLSVASKTEFGVVKAETLGFVNFFRAHWGGIETFGKAVWSKLAAAASFLYKTFKPAIQEVVKTVRFELARIAAFWKAHGAQVMAILHAFWAAVLLVAKPALTMLIGVIKGAMNIIAGVIRVVAALMRGDWKSVWDGMKQIAKGASGIVESIVRGLAAIIGNVLRAAWNGAKAAASAAWSGMVNAARSGVSDVVSFVKSLPGKIVSALGNLGSLLWNAGAALMKGLLNGIVSGLQSVWSTVSSIAGKIKSLKGPLEYDRILLTPAGTAIMQGLVKGIEAQRGALRTTLGGVTGDIRNGVRPGVGAGGLGASPRLAAAGGASASGDIFKFTLTGDIYATSAAQAQMTTSQLTRQVMQKFSAAKRSTGRGKGTR